MLSVAKSEAQTVSRGMSDPAGMGERPDGSNPRRHVEKYGERKRERNAVFRRAIFL